MRLLGGLSRPLLIAVLALGLAAPPLAAWQASRWGRHAALAELHTAAQHRLDLYSANLTAEFDKHATLPFVLAQDEAVAELLHRPVDAALVDRLNRHLEGLSAGTADTVLYVMDTDGLTLAASNWRNEEGFVGRSFAYRPYFQTALAGQIGRYFALGSTSRRPGYYVAHPVKENGAAILGVVVAKVGVDTLEKSWPRDPERVVVTDPDGIVFLTNVEAWRFHAMAPLPPAVAERVEQSLQYTAGNPIETLPATAADGEIQVKESRLLPGTDWTLHVILDMEPVWLGMTAAAAIAALATLVVVLVGCFLLERRLALRRRILLQKRLLEELEQRVSERTGELSDANLRLRAEVREKERAQDVLRKAQDELVQAGKLAALGQMSAGIAHEVNQPLAAIRSYSDNALAFLERGREEPACDNLREISRLTERIASITHHLKTFARKSTGHVEPVNTGAAIDGALALMGARLQTDQVELVRVCPDDPVWVMGEEVRLEQVLINLFRNALDAMKNSARKVLSVTVATKEEAGHSWVVLAIRDTGPGIKAEHMPQLFFPFFTTKDVGEGLGLGLSISYGIIRDFGGTIAAANHAEGGAEFTIILKRTEPS